MKPWRRVALWFAGVATVLGICAAIALHAMVDPERLKTMAREKAREEWGHDLLIGDMKIGSGPLLRLQRPG